MDSGGDGAGRWPFFVAQRVSFLLLVLLGPIPFSTSPKTVHSLPLLFGPFSLIPAHSQPTYPCSVLGLLLSYPGLFPLPALVQHPLPLPGPDPRSLGLGSAGLELEGSGIRAWCDHTMGTRVLVTEPGGHPLS